MTNRPIFVLIRKTHEGRYPKTVTFEERGRAFEAVDEILSDTHGLAWLFLTENVDGEQHELVRWP